LQTYNIVAINPDGTLNNDTSTRSEFSLISDTGHGMATRIAISRYLGIVEVTRQGRRPVTARLGRVFEVNRQNLLDGTAYYGENETAIVPGGTMHVFGRIRINDNLFYGTVGNHRLHFYGIPSLPGSLDTNLSIVTAGGLNNFPMDATWGPGGLHEAIWHYNGTQSNANKPLVSAEYVPPAYPFALNPNEHFDATDGNPNNESFRELIERPDPDHDDPEAIASARFYNRADVTILVDPRIPPYSANPDGTFSPNPDRVTVQTKNHAANTSDAKNNVTPAPGTPVDDWSPLYRGVWEALGLSAEPNPANSNMTGGSIMNDSRELQHVFLTDVNVEALSRTMAANVTGQDNLGFNGLVYIADVVADENQGTGTASVWNPNLNGTGSGGYQQRSALLNGIRLQNGARLPSDLVQQNNPDGGFFLASNTGVYVQGDFNTGRHTADNGTTVEPRSNTNAAIPGSADVFADASNVEENRRAPTGPAGGNFNYHSFPETSDYMRKPAMVAADTLTFLSNAWRDDRSSLGVGARSATNTTYNLVVLAGKTEEPYGTETRTSRIYDGGIENFGRLLEHWGNRRFTFYGSQVQLWYSEIFKAPWRRGGNPPYQNPAVRAVYYDSMLTTADMRSAGFIGVPSFRFERGQRVVMNAGAN